MSVSLYDVTVGNYLQIAQAAQGFLAKGAAHCAENDIDPQSIVESRLYDDMATLHFQVQCIQHHSVGAIRGVQSGEFAPPPDIDPLDYAGLQAFIDTAVADLQGFDADEVDALAGGRLVFKIGGNELPFSAENFILSFSLPNFYFHATTAYDILRSKGVPLGKMDFLGSLKMG